MLELGIKAPDFELPDQAALRARPRQKNINFIKNL